MSVEVIDVPFPDGWLTSDWAVLAAPAAAVDLPDGRLAILVSGCLGDGTNLHALAYPGGVRYARLRQASGWAVEERYEGDPPAEQDAETISSVWRDFLGCVVKGLHDAIEEFGGRP